MSGLILQRLRESLVERRNELAEWFQQSSAETRSVRVGPNGMDQVREQLTTLDTAIERAEAGTLGICNVCHDTVEESALEMDYAASVCLAHLSGDERSRLETDLELSQKVQKALLPESTPHIPELDIAAFSRPALIVGGDYFDFFQFQGGSHGFVVADVMGKGMAASLLMASFQASLRIIAPESTQPHEAVGRLNKIFRHNIRLTKFVTAFLARYDARSGILSYCNAGHNPPLLAGVDGEFRTLMPTGAAIGLVEGTPFETVSVPFRAGDRLLVYTDGVVELPGPGAEMFGDDRLRELFAMTMGEPSARGIIRTIRRRLEAFSGSPVPHDDTTMIAIVARG